MSHKERHYLEKSSRIPIKIESGDPGYYEGEIRLKIHRPKNAVGKLWLQVREQVNSFKPFK